MALGESLKSRNFTLNLYTILMKNIYSKILIITILLIGINKISTAQDWMVGDMIDDTLSYLTVQPTAPNEFISCYDIGTSDFYFNWPMSADPGIDMGFVVSSITSSDSVEISPDGHVEEGDTIWLVDDPYWIATERNISFHNADGAMTLRFFAIGVVTMPDIAVPCQPADSMWMNSLAVCNNYTWTGWGACTTMPNPLGVDDLSMSDLGITYPTRLNGYTLTSTSEDISKLEVYDIQGKKIAESLENAIDCSNLNSGTYILSVGFDTGNAIREKFILIK